MRPRRARRERGSALLIVFVFAAMVAIMLYAEMPVAVFEAKRQKEQLLIDRGQEYSHAVKLFVRKFGMYPATIEQLENTNRMRFLRHRFKDPFTGKDNWRMLHAGPGGMLTDSKVKPAGLGNVPGSGPEASSGSSFGSTTSGSSFGSGSGSTGFGSSSTSSSASTGFGSSSTSSGFGQSGFGSTSQSAGDVVVVPELPQRPPAISASGAPASGSASGEVAAMPAEGDQSSAGSLVPGLREQMTALEQGQPVATTENAGQAVGSGQSGAGAAPGQNNAAGQAATTGAADGQSAMDTVRKMPTNPAIGAPLQSSTGTTSSMGQISGGGIAGVASNAHGHTIKTVNDQTDYSLWEFYYDPTKDATKGMPGLAGGAQGGVQPGAAANGLTQGANPGSNGQTMFQQSGFGQSGFGQSSSSMSSAGTATGPTSTGTTANPPQSNPQQ